LYALDGGPGVLRYRANVARVRAPSASLELARKTTAFGLMIAIAASSGGYEPQARGSGASTPAGSGRWPFGATQPGLDS
jgi:hypothetical protein